MLAKPAPQSKPFFPIVAGGIKKTGNTKHVWHGEGAITTDTKNTKGARAGPAQDCQRKRPQRARRGTRRSTKHDGDTITTGTTDTKGRGRGPAQDWMDGEGKPQIARIEADLGSATADRTAREARAVGSGQRAKPAERPAEPASLPRNLASLRFPQEGSAAEPRRIGRRAEIASAAPMAAAWDLASRSWAASRSRSDSCAAPPPSRSVGPAAPSARQAGRRSHGCPR